LRLGRSRQSEIILDHSSISRRHAEIALSDGGWVVRDTGSTNGTFLNGARVSRQDRKLAVADLIQCGNLVFAVQELVEEPVGLTDSVPASALQVQATTESSWDEAVEWLAADVTRHSRPGEPMLALLRAGQHLCQSDSLDELLQLHARDAVKSLAAQRCSILLMDSRTNKVTVKAVFTNRPELSLGRAFSTTLALRCFRNSQSLLCQDVRADADLLRAKSIAGGEMSSVICALMRTPHRRIGVLHLDRGLSQPTFTTEDLRLADALAAHLSVAIEGAQNLQEKQRSLFVNTVIILAQAIEMRDEYTGGHTQRVTDYSLLLGEKLGLTSADRQLLQIGAPLHDIGKIGVDDAVLRKQGRLTPTEFEHMKSHAVKGAAMLTGIPDLEGIIPIVRNHHERWDGKGYPDALTGQHIPRLARLVAVADTFDAMTSDRPYRMGMSASQAFAEIERSIGSQFDPECAKAFLEVRHRVEQLLLQSRAAVDTKRNLAKVSDLHKLLACAQPA
jgi:putative nucleotidyltransferase with HDIG domain